MVVVLLAVSLGAAYVGSAVIARHRAQSAADLAALTGATALPNGVPLACGQAAEVARAMGTTVIACTVKRLDLVVTVEASLGLALFGGPARAAARAGPASREKPGSSIATS